MSTALIIERALLSRESIAKVAGCRAEGRTTGTQREQQHVSKEDTERPQRGSAGRAPAVVRTEPAGARPAAPPPRARRAVRGPRSLPSRPGSAASPGSPARKWTPAPGVRSPAAAGNSPAAPQRAPPAAAARRWPGPCQRCRRGRAAVMAGPMLPPCDPSQSAARHRLCRGGRRRRSRGCRRRVGPGGSSAGTCRGGTEP